MNPTDATPAVNQLQAAINGMAHPSAEGPVLRTLMAQANGETQSSGPALLSSSPTLTGLLEALRRRWAIALGLSILATVAVVLAIFQLMPPKYMVSIRLRVAAKQAGPEDIEFPIYKANMEWLVKSPLVLTTALNDKLPDGREVKDLEIVRSKGMGAVAWLDKALKTDYLLGPEILRVTLPADQSEEAAELLNAITKAYLNECAEKDRSKKQERLTELRRNKENIEENLRNLRQIRDQQFRALDVKDREAMNVQQQSWIQKLGAVETAKTSNAEELAKAQNEIISVTAKLKNLDRFHVPEDLLEDYFSKDRTILEYEKKMGDLQQLIMEYKSKYYEPYASQYALPKQHERLKIKMLKEQRQQELLPEIERKYRVRVREELENQLAFANEKKEGYSRRQEALFKDTQELERKVKESGSNANKPAAIVATEEKIEVARMGLNQTATKIGEVELEVPGARVSALERANPPSERDISRQTKVAGAGGLSVFFLMLFGVAFMEFQSRKISVTQDISQGLGLKILGTVPAMPARTRKVTAKSAAQDQIWQHQLNESIDALRTVLLHSARTEPLRIIMISSASSGEGKTTLTTQLAASLARAWKRTLIIDGDLRHPAAHQLLDVPQEPGLSEVLRGEVEVADAIRATSFSRLWILPAGNGDTHAIQALAQDSVETLFATLKQQYDFIIIDSPPIMPVTDSLLIGQHVDGVVFSILRNVSRAPAVYAAQQKLATLDVHALGAVILGAKPEFSCKKYSYALSPSK